MKLFIQFPTRSRPNRFTQYLLRYVEYLEDKSNFHIQVSCDTDDKTMNDPYMIHFIKCLRNVSIVFNDNRSKIEAINTGIPRQGWDVLLLASDDMWPVTKGYDNVIRKEMKKNFPDTDGVLHFNDGIHGKKLNTLAILGNKYYNRFNYVYHPKYKSLYADNEFHEISKQLNKQSYSDTMIIQHLRKEVKRDNLHKINHYYAQRDKLRYERWKENNII